MASHLTIKVLKMACVGKHQGPAAPSGKLSQDPRITPGLVVPSTMGHSPSASEYSGQSQVLIWQSYVPQAVNEVNPGDKRSGPLRPIGALRGLTVFSVLILLAILLNTTAISVLQDHTGQSI